MFIVKQKARRARKGLTSSEQTLELLIEDLNYHLKDGRYLERREQFGPESREGRLYL